MIQENETPQGQVKLIANRLFEYFPIAKDVAHRFDPVESRKVNCLVILATLDIFRALRKYVFVSKKKIRRELEHLFHAGKMPSHYPQCLQRSDDRGINLVKLNYEEIKTINSLISSIDINVSKGWVYRYLLISDNFFNQLVYMESLNYLESAISSLFGLTGARNYYDQSKAEVRNFQMQGSIPIDFKTPGQAYYYANFTECSLFVSNQERGAKKRLLVEGELDGHLKLSIYFSSLSVNVPKKETPLAALLLCSMHKVMMNSFGSRSYVQISNEKFSFHIRKGKNERYYIKEQLDEDYVVPVGNYRLNRVVKCPIQFIDKQEEGNSVQTYVRSITPPLHTKHFIEEFDGHELLKILESIPGFVYKFSEQQRELIASKQNAVVVGRSGTGKTTCAVMRMIGIRLLEIAHKNAAQGIKKIRYRDLCESKPV
jgi:hypothetical protein